MAKINGTLYAVYTGSDKVLHTVNGSLNLEQDLPDVTNKESAGWAEHINGLRKWSIDFEGKYDEAGSGFTPDEIMAAIIARTADTVIQFKPTTGATKGWTGNGTFKSIKLGADLEGGLTYSGSIQGNGALALIT
jgi:predicted secreted protein